MSALHPIAVYGLTVPAGDVMVPALTDLPATVCFLLQVLRQGIHCGLLMST